MAQRCAIPAVLLALALATPVAASFDPGPAHDPRIADGSLQRELDQARRSWRAAGARSYRYDIYERCFCPPQKSVRVVVRDGRPATHPQYLKALATVPRLFRTIQAAIDDDVAKLTVSYGPRGVPRSISIDRAVNVADDEVRYAVKRFTRLSSR